MDVLAYSAFNQQVALNQQITEKTSCLSSKCSETAALQAAAAGFDAAATCWVQCREPCLLRCPYAITNWDYIPSLTGASTGFKVCDTQAQFNCGATCSWVVPAGVTRARFQLWGAGGGANKAPCCCGDNPFGSTGAYASVIIPVTAASTYTICSGCAYCCMAANTAAGTQRMPGCPSYVSGTGLVNFCAAGGSGTIGTWMAAYGKSSPCHFGTNACTGHSICDTGGTTCVPSGCESGGIIPYVPGAAYFGTTTSASSPSIVYGVRGMWPLICWDTNNYGYQCHPPIVGFVASSQCNPSYTSGSCCGYNCRAAAGYLQIPGAGGFYSHAMGGGVSLCGDMGRMGMVCVTYC